MEPDEQDYQILLEKLERMEDFLKSFMSSLEEPLEKKEVKRRWVRAPVTGKIHRWHRRTGHVVSGELLCKMNSNLEEQDRKPPVLHSVRSPADGQLDVPAQYLYESNEIGKGSVIAYVEEDSDPF